MINGNSYAFHQENLLVSLISDHTSQANRELGVNGIKTARRLAQEAKDANKRKSKKNHAIREFRRPKVNLDLTSIDQHLDMEALGPWEPPITVGIPTEDLERQILEWGTISFPSVPCNTQAVERAIKLVTEVVARKRLPETRNREIRITLDAREHPLKKPSVSPTEMLE